VIPLQKKRCKTNRTINENQWNISNLQAYTPNKGGGKVKQIITKVLAKFKMEEGKE